MCEENHEEQRQIVEKEKEGGEEEVISSKFVTVIKNRTENRAQRQLNDEVCYQSSFLLG